MATTCVLILLTLSLFHPSCLHLARSPARPYLPKLRGADDAIKERDDKIIALEKALRMKTDSETKANDKLRRAERDFADRIRRMEVGKGARTHHKLYIVLGPAV